MSENGEANRRVWKDSEAKLWDSSDDIDPEEAITRKCCRRSTNSCPVKELAGRLIHLPVLRQFGLVENEKVDGFLASAFAKTEPTLARAVTAPEQINNAGGSKTSARIRALLRRNEVLNFVPFEKPG